MVKGDLFRFNDDKICYSEKNNLKGVVLFFLWFVEILTTLVLFMLQSCQIAVLFLPQFVEGCLLNQIDPNRF